MYLQHKGHADGASHRRDVADEIETELVVDRRVGGVVRGHSEERVAVRRRAHDRLGTDIGGAARPVLDDEWLAEPLRRAIDPSGARTCRTCRRQELAR